VSHLFFFFFLERLVSHLGLFTPRNASAKDVVLVAKLSMHVGIHDYYNALSNAYKLKSNSSPARKVRKSQSVECPLSGRVDPTSFFAYSEDLDHPSLSAFESRSCKLKTTTPC
jgi:hypothetical protein